MPFLKHSESTKKEQLIFTLATIQRFSQSLQS